MAKLINAGIALSKLQSAPYTTAKGAKCIMIPIDQDGITEKDGKVYLNLQIGVNDEKDKYENDCSISISQNKEEREAKKEKVYIGNGKTFWESNKSIPDHSAKLNEPAPIGGDDLPF